MHGVSEVDWRSAALQLADLATRREYINLIRKQVDLDVVDEVHRTGTAELVEQPRYPFARAHLRRRLTVTLTELVLPVRGDAALGHMVHVARADLDLALVAFGPDASGMQRLVAVRFLVGDEIGRAHV